MSNSEIFEWWNDMVQWYDMIQVFWLHCQSSIINLKHGLLSMVDIWCRHLWYSASLPPEGPKSKMEVNGQKPEFIQQIPEVTPNESESKWIKWKENRNLNFQQKPTCLDHWMCSLPSSGVLTGVLILILWVWLWEKIWWNQLPITVTGIFWSHMCVSARWKGTHSCSNISWFAFPPKWPPKTPRNIRDHGCLWHNVTKKDTHVSHTSQWEKCSYSIDPKVQQKQVSKCDLATCFSSYQMESESWVISNHILKSYHHIISDSDLRSLFYYVNTVYHIILSYCPMLLSWYWKNPDLQLVFETENWKWIV